MCKALEDLYNDGIECGIEQGIERGSIAGCKRVNRLNCILAEKKRIDDCRQPPLVADEATFDGQSGPY